MQRIVMDDLVGFLMVYGLCLMGFSSAFFLLVRYEFVDDTTMSMPGDYNTLLCVRVFPCPTRPPGDFLSLASLFMWTPAMFLHR